MFIERKVVLFIKMYYCGSFMGRVRWFPEWMEESRAEPILGCIEPKMGSDDQGRRIKCGRELFGQAAF